LFKHCILRASKLNIMKKQNRRDFILTGAFLSTSLTTSAISPGSRKKKGDQFIHHVLFWLKNPESKADLNKLIDGSRQLENIETVRQIHIGVPAAVAPRPVVDSTYSLSLLVYFKDLAGQDAYQVHPIHQEFLKNHSQLWERIRVYDSMGV